MKQETLTKIFEVLVVPVILVAVAWGVLQARTNANADAIQDMQNHQTSLEQQIVILNTNMYLVCDKLSVKCIEPK